MRHRYLLVMAALLVVNGLGAIVLASNHEVGLIIVIISDLLLVLVMCAHPSYQIVSYPEAIRCLDRYLSEKIQGLSPDENTLARYNFLKQRLEQIEDLKTQSEIDLALGWILAEAEALSVIRYEDHSIETVQTLIRRAYD